MKEHYVTLVSNASMDIFEDNRLSSFRTRLPYPLDFTQGDWLVALTEITYTKSWFNVESGHFMQPCYADDMSKIVDSLKETAKAEIVPGYYSNAEHLIEHLNDRMESAWMVEGITSVPELELLPSQKLSLKSHGVESGSGSKLPKNYTVCFDETMALILGTKKKPPVYLDQGMTSLYIYCDIVQPQVVGNTTAPLLRTIGVRSEAIFGENVTEILETPYYLPLSRTYFQELSVHIRNDQGLAPPFNFGRVTCTLHFVQT